MVAAWSLLWVFYDRLRPPMEPWELLPGPVTPSDNSAPDFIDRRLGSGIAGSGWRQWQRLHGLESHFRPNHNLHHLLDNALLDKRPEWFPLIDGERHTMAGGKGPQPNLANPGFAGHVAEQVLRFWEEHPEKRAFSISITDSLKFDESEATRKIVEPHHYFRHRPDYSDLVFRFANRVAEEVFGAPDSVPEACSRYLTAYAYFWAENVPGIATSQPTGLHPCLIPYLTSDRAQWWDPDYRKNDRDLIRRWGAAGTEFIGGRDYYMGQGYFIPRHYPSLVAKSLQHLHANNGRVFYAEGTPIWGFNAPLYWLAAQLLREVDRDPEALLNHFFQTQYGPAAPFMQAFFERCEAIWMNQPGDWRWLKYYRHPSQAELFPPEVCEELMGLLNRAYEAVGGELPSRAQPGRDSPANPFPETWHPMTGSHALYRARVALTLNAFEFTRAASRYYHAWKDCAANSMENENQRRSFQVDLKRYQRAREALESLPDIAGPNPRWSARRRLLLLDPKARQLLINQDDPSGNGHYSFDSLLSPGDIRGLDPWKFRDAPLRNGLSLAVQPYEKYEFRRLTSGGRTGGAVQIRNSNYTSLYQWIRVEPGRETLASAWFRGHIQPGAWTGLYVSYHGSDLKPLDADYLDESPPGMHRDWIPLAVRSTPPAQASWAFVALRVVYQQPGDWVLLDDFKFSSPP